MQDRQSQPLMAEDTINVYTQLVREYKLRTREREILATPLRLNEAFDVVGGYI